MASTFIYYDFYEVVIEHSQLQFYGYVYSYVVLSI
jgi:hypothetical protein